MGVFLRVFVGFRAFLPHNFCHFIPCFDCCLNTDLPHYFFVACNRLLLASKINKMQILKDFIRLIFGIPEDEPVSNTNALLTIIGLLFIIVMLALFQF